MENEAATTKQSSPHGQGRDIATLVQQDILTRPVLVPEKGFETVALWVRSAAAYIKSRQLEAEGNGVQLPSVLQVARGLHDDIEARVKMGEAKYGERLRAFNGRDPLVDAFQELLDCWNYLRQYEEESEVRK